MANIVVSVTGCPPGIKVLGESSSANTKVESNGEITVDGPASITFGLGGKATQFTHFWVSTSGDMSDQVDLMAGMSLGDLSMTKNSGKTQLTLKDDDKTKNVTYHYKVCVQYTFLSSSRNRCSDPRIYNKGT